MVFREISQLSIVIRILSAIIVGGLIGLERGRKNRPAGLRTYMLVCTGACLIMLTNQYIYQFTSMGDPTRLGAQVVSGIGFLGAGTIIVTRHNQIKGLTTAAGLWASAGVGLALGIGFYEGALTAAMGVYAILSLLQRWEHRVHKKIRIMEIYVELQNSVPLSDFTRKLRAEGFQIESIQFEANESLENNARAVVVSLKFPKREDRMLLIEKIQDIEGVLYFEEL